MIIFDVETQKLATEVGGWANIEAMQLSVACTWDEQHGYRSWWESQAADLIDELHRADLIVGFNITSFDYRVLSLYGRTDDLNEKTFDVFDEVKTQVGGRRRGLSLNRLAQINLGESKTLESGIMAVMLFRANQLQTLEAYCRRDVELTRRLYELWKNQGVLFTANEDFVVWTGK